MVAAEERQDTTGCRPDGIIPRRVTAELDGDVVVFLIGMRINTPWKLHKWLPVLAMPRMLKELQARPELGLLAVRRIGLLTFVQYWRSFAQLGASAHAPDQEHWPAWVAFNRRMKERCGDAGIWHEAYLVSAGRYEVVYSGMPRVGLAAALAPSSS
jgi:hypothetical protein